MAELDGRLIGTRFFSNLQIPGYDHHGGVIIGFETHTLSPVRFARGDELHGLNIAGLFPAGEGAGYAGGILCAAVDGIKIAEGLALSFVGAPAGAD